MAIYRAQFHWPLPPHRASVERYAEVLSQSAGYPCKMDLLREAEGRITATMSFPRLIKGNFISLSDDLCELEFAPVPFFWAHATHSAQALGGSFTKPVISDRQDWTRRQWHELKWTERARIVVGLGGSVV